MAFVIPSIFTAIDKFSAPLAKMKTGLVGFSEQMETGVSKMERGFRKMLPTMNHVAEDMLKAFGAAYVASKVMEGIEFSFEQLEKYDQALVNLKVTTGLSGEEFKKYEESILSVAKASGRSVIDVADVFNVIAKSNPELRDNVDLMSKVGASAILLAKAANMELAPAADELTTILRRMKIPAEEANDVVNKIAGSAQASKYSIADMGLALNSFAGTAKQAGLNLTQSLTLTAMGSQFADATSEGIKLQKVLAVLSLQGVSQKQKMELRKAGVNIKLMSNPVTDLKTRLTELAKVQSHGNIMLDLFTRRARDFAAGLLGNVGAYDKIVAATERQGAAEKAAAENEATLTKSVLRLKNAWVSMLVENGEASKGMTGFMKLMDFMTEHINAIGSVLYIAAAALGGYVAILLSAKLALYAINTATKLVAAAQWLWNTALMGTEVTLGTMAIPIVALIGLIYELSTAFSKWGFLDEMKKLGAAIVFWLLIPIQKILEGLGMIPGMSMVATGAKMLGNFTDKMYNISRDENDANGKPLVNNNQIQHEAMIQKLESVNSARADVNLIAPKGWGAQSEQVGKGVLIHITSTM